MKVHDEMEVVVLTKYMQWPLARWRCGSCCSYIGGLQSLGVSKIEMFCATIPQALIGSHSTFKNGVVSVTAFSI